MILADKLTTTSTGDTSLTGPNQVASFQGSTASGDLSLRNDVALAVTGISAAGMLDLDVAGALSLSAGGTQDARITSVGGQTIHAQSLAVIAQDGRSASLVNHAEGDQTITISGGGASSGVDVRTLSVGSSAMVSNETVGGKQSIIVSDADHINIGGVGGAQVFALQGTQDISITGSGANAFVLGSAGARGGANVNALSQNITAGLAGQSGSITIVGTAANNTIAGVVTNSGIGSDTQTITTSGTISVTGGSAPTQGASFNSGIFHNRQGQQRITAANIVVQGGSGGSGNGAFISSLNGGDQVVDVAGGSISITGGNSGSGNVAGITTLSTGNQQISVAGGNITLNGGGAGSNNNASLNSNFANQTILGNADISVSGGAGGNATIAAGLNRSQSITARNISLTNSAAGGINSTASIVATNQAINATGNVTLTARASGGDLGGVRIGGSSGGSTNLNLGVGGDLVLNGGTAPNNGAGIGSSAAGTPQPNTIAITTGGSVILNSGTAAGSGARIGTPASASTIAPGTISVTAGAGIQLANDTGIRATGPITLTANSLTNAGVISNGGGASTANMTLNANAFSLAGGTIDAGSAAVLIRPRTGTNSFGIESASATTITNADIASINTSNFVVFGSGTDTIFTGNMTIGANAQVDGGSKNLAFLRSTIPGGTTTIGAHGVSSSGDLNISAGGGALLSNGGTVAGNQVQLRGTQGIGTSGARVQTAANALTVGTSGGAFVAEADDVTLRTIATNVGGNTALNITNTTTGGVLDLTVGGALNVAGSVTSGAAMSINAAGALNVSGTGTQDGVLRSTGGQTITAQSVNLTAQDSRRANIENTNGSQTITATAGGMNLQVPGGAGVAQIINTGGDQTVAMTGQLNVLGGVISPTTSRNSGIFKNGGGIQTVSASGITPAGASTGTSAGALISSQGDQFINVAGGNINLLGGNGGTGNNAAISASAAGQQTILAHDISLSNGFGGIDTAATITGGRQTIDITGNLTLSAQGALASGGTTGPGVRIGAPGASTTGTELTLLVDGNIMLNGGSATDNGSGIGSSSFGTPMPNTILIDAGGSVILNGGTLPGTGARIGSSVQNGAAGGNLSIKAGGSIELNGTVPGAGTAIRTLGDVTLQAASISEASNGFIVANALTTTTSGNTNLTGPNQIASFNATSTGGDVSLRNTGVLDVTGMNAFGDATINNIGDVTVSGPWTAGGTSTISVGSDIVLNAKMQSRDVVLNANDGAIIQAPTASIVADSRPQTPPAIRCSMVSTR